MVSRDNRLLGDQHLVNRTIAFWFALDRGWQAVVLGLGIVAMYQLFP